MTPVYPTVFIHIFFYIIYIFHWFHSTIFDITISSVFNNKMIPSSILTPTFLVKPSSDTFILTRPGGRQGELFLRPPLKAGERWPPWVGDGGINSLFVIPVSARWALLSLKTDYKISSFHPEIPGFDPGTFGVESWRTSDELPSSSVVVTIKTHPEYKHSDHGKYFTVVGCTVKSLWYKLIVYSINTEYKLIVYSKHRVYI